MLVYQGSYMKSARCWAPPRSQAAWVDCPRSPSRSPPVENNAQDESLDVNPDADPRVQAEQEAGELIVTGSRIARPNLDLSVPITSVSIAELTNTGNVLLGDRLNQLPALRPTLGQSNSISSIGTAGLNALDLRGLGTARTLVLVNGAPPRHGDARHQPGRRQHHPDRPHRARRRRDRRQFGDLRLGRGGGRREFRRSSVISKASAFALRAASATRAIAAITSPASPAARISPTVAATSPCRSNMHR
ncbi:TonB-dependent receptor plug domain-containing protein [Sphingomonas sp. MMS24-JH45]